LGPGLAITKACHFQSLENYAGKSSFERRPKCFVAVNNNINLNPRRPGEIILLGPIVPLRVISVLKCYSDIVRKVELKGMTAASTDIFIQSSSSNSRRKSSSREQATTGNKQQQGRPQQRGCEQHLACRQQQ
jgi:hypothetical protein